MSDFILPGLLSALGFYGCLFPEGLSRLHRRMAVSFLFIGAVNIGRYLILHGIK